VKITQIKFANYLHFKKGLVLDLTYPLGHELAGKPLNRVCVIGQSGTGKTSILNIIKCFTAENDQFDDRFIDRSKLEKKAVEVHYEVGEDHFYKVRSDNQDFDYWKNGQAQSQEYKKHIQGLVPRPRLVFFPFNVIPAELADQTATLKDNQLAFNPRTGDLKVTQPADKAVWDLSIPEIDVISEMVFQEIDQHVLKFKDISTEYMNQVVKDPTKAAELAELRKKWETQNPNPIEKLAEDCLNSLLEHFGLQVETDPGSYKLDDAGKREKHNFLILKRSGEHIEYKYLSTGTKQLILTILPLFFLKPKNAVVLFDQPEASLFPNIQLLLPELYAGVAPDNQFIHATHSPIVASAFDPWEVVDLRFGNDGSVYREEYFDPAKGRSVESYLTYPKYLRWDSMFKVMFGLQVEGNEERRAQLMELAKLERQVAKEGDEAKKKELFDEYVSLARKLDWPAGDGNAPN
jgi:hypothetical protein